MNNKNPKQILINDNFNLFVKFDDNEIRYVNLKTWLDGASKIKTDLDFCKQAFIEHGYAISWPNGISIDPEIIYAEGKKIKDFPKANNQSGIPIFVTKPSFFAMAVLKYHSPSSARLT